MTYEKLHEARKLEDIINTLSFNLMRFCKDPDDVDIFVHNIGFNNGMLEISGELKAQILALLEKDWREKLETAEANFLSL